MSKQLLVSSTIQAVLMNEFLLDQIRNGHWKGQRPSTHAAAWDDVEIVVSTTNQVGPIGDWKPLRYYDFLNPEFTKLHETKLVEIASTVRPNTKFKSLKKELIELARIIGGRMSDKTVEPARVYRGNNRSDFDVIRSIERKKVLTTAKVKVSVDPTESVVKRTAVKLPKVDENQVITMTTAAGATVRRVPVSAEKVEA